MDQAKKPLKTGAQLSKKTVKPLYKQPEPQTDVNALITDIRMRINDQAPQDRLKTFQQLGQQLGIEGNDVQISAALKQRFFRGNPEEIRNIATLVGIKPSTKDVTRTKKPQTRVVVSDPYRDDQFIPTTGPEGLPTKTPSGTPIVRTGEEVFTPEAPITTGRRMSLARSLATPRTDLERRKETLRVAENLQRSKSLEEESGVFAQAIQAKEKQLQKEGKSPAEISKEVVKLRQEFITQKKAPKEKNIFDKTFDKTVESAQGLGQRFLDKMINPPAPQEPQTQQFQFGPGEDVNLAPENAIENKLAKSMGNLLQSFAVKGVQSPEFQTEAAPTVPEITIFNAISNAAIQAQKDPNLPDIGKAALKSLPFTKIAKVMAEGGDITQLESITAPENVEAPRELIFNIMKSFDPNFQEPENPIELLGYDLLGSLLIGSPQAAHMSITRATKALDAVRAAKALKNAPGRVARLRGQMVQQAVANQPKALPAPSELGDNFKILSRDTLKQNKELIETGKLDELGNKIGQAIEDSLTGKTSIGGIPSKGVPKQLPPGTPGLTGEGFRRVNPSEVVAAEQIKQISERKTLAKQLKQGESFEQVATQTPKSGLGEKGMARIGKSFEGMSEDELRREVAKLKQELGRGRKPVAQGQAQAIPVTPKVKPATEIPPSVKSVTEALKKAKELKPLQAEMRSEELGKRVAAAIKAREAAGGGQAGHKAFLSKLGGSFKQPDGGFETLAGKITQNEIDDMINTINKNPGFSEFDKTHATEGFLKLFGEKRGQLPEPKQIELLEQVFGDDFTKVLLDKRPINQKIKEGIFQALNFTRPILTMLDAGFIGRNARFVISRPILTAKATKASFPQAFSEKVFQESQKAIYNRPSYLKAKQYGLDITDLSHTMARNEESAVSTWAEQIPLLGPLVRGSNRAATGFLNRMRIDMWDTFMKNNPKFINDEKFLRTAAKYINTATFRGELGAFSKYATELNTLLWSPKGISSRINLMNPLFYGSLHKQIFKESMRDLAGTLSTGFGQLALAKMAGAEVETDMRSSDFGKIKIGNTRIDVWGGFLPQIRSMAQFISGTVKSTNTGKVSEIDRWKVVRRYLRNKLSPTVGLGVTAFSQKDAKGDEINWAEEGWKYVTPIVLQNLKELHEEDPKLDILELFDFFGQGVQVYGGKADERAKERSEQIRLERKIKKITG